MPGSDKPTKILPLWRLPPRTVVVRRGKRQDPLEGFSARHLHFQPVPVETLMLHNMTWEGASSDP